MPYNVSPTSLKLMQDCERCFWLALKKGIKRPEGITSSLPNGMDKILKIHFDLYRDKGELPPELQEKCQGYRLFGDMELLKVWRNNFKGLVYHDSSGLTIKGAVDEILAKPGKLIVLDFKTRGFPRKEDTHSHYQVNMDLYNLLLRKNGYMTEDYSYLLFYHPLKIEVNGNILFNADLLKMETSAERGLKIVKKAADILQKEDEREVFSDATCSYCSYRNGHGVQL